RNCYAVNVCVNGNCVLMGFVSLLSSFICHFCCSKCQFIQFLQLSLKSLKCESVLLLCLNSIKSKFVSIFRSFDCFPCHCLNFVCFLFMLIGQSSSLKRDLRHPIRLLTKLSTPFSCFFESTHSIR